MPNKQIDKKSLIESLNKIKDEAADKNRALLEDFGHANKHLGSGIYKTSNVVDLDEMDEDQHEEIPGRDDSQEATSPFTDDTIDERTNEPSQVEPKPAAKPTEQKLPDNIVFDGDFPDPEKKAILSMSDKNWTPMFKRELLASKEDMLEGFDNNPDFIVRAIDENEKVVFIPYKYFDQLFFRNKEATLNIKNTPIKFMLMIPKNYDDHSMAAAYGEDDALVKRVDGEKTVISKMDLSTFNSIFTKDKKQNIRAVERDLTYKEPVKKPEPKAKPIPKPKLKMVDEDDVKKAIPKPIGKPKLRMVEEMPDPQSLAGKDIIVNSKDTGRRDNRIRINSFNPSTNKFSINFRKLNYSVPLEYIQKSYVREAK